MMWQYLGAMMSEKKDGRMAASFTRVLGVSMFLLCNLLWVLEIAGAVISGPPSEMVYTLWGLIGVKGAKDFAKSLQGHSSYESKFERNL